MMIQIDNTISNEKKNILNLNNNLQDKLYNLKENNYNEKMIKKDLDHLNKNFSINSLNNIKEFMNNINNSSDIMEMEQNKIKFI